MRRGPSGRRRNPPPTCPKLLLRPGQLTLGAYVRRSSRSVWSGFRPDMSEGAWRPPRGWPFNPLLPKQFLVHARDHPAALPRCVQIALKPASKALGLHGVFIRSKGLKYLIADGAFKRMQVDAPGARWLDADEGHLPCR